MVSSINIFDPHRFINFALKNFRFNRIYFLLFRFIISSPSALHNTTFKILCWKKTSKCKQTILKNIPRSHWMVERSPSGATNATTHAIGLAIWKVICWFKVVRSILLAQSAIIPSQELLNSRHTCWVIREKNLSVATNANTHPHCLLLSSYTCWLIQEKSVSAARIVVTSVHYLVFSKDTSRPI